MISIALLFLTATGLPDSLIAGSYYAGPPLCVAELVIRTDHSYELREMGDVVGMGTAYKGAWGYDHDVLVLKRGRKHDLRFVPVTWGNAVTLIDEDKAPAFLAALPPPPADLHSTEFVKCAYQVEHSYIDIQFAERSRQSKSLPRSRARVGMEDIRRHERDHTRLLPIERGGPIWCPPRFH